MELTDTLIPEVKILTPTVYSDARGCFFESFNSEKFNALMKKKINFVQDNHSHSGKNVLRGLHYQIKQPQGKLVRVTSGKVFDVAIDLRKHSPTFAKWAGVILSAENKKQLWIPEGFAHGFLVLSEHADFLYKTTTYYAPEFERTIRWNDPTIGIDWPTSEEPVLSKKDSLGVDINTAELY